MERKTSNLQLTTKIIENSTSKISTENYLKHIKSIILDFILLLQCINYYILKLLSHDAFCSIP